MEFVLSEFALLDQIVLRWGHEHMEEPFSEKQNGYKNGVIGIYGVPCFGRFRVCIIIKRQRIQQGILCLFVIFEYLKGFVDDGFHDIARCVIAVTGDISHVAVFAEKRHENIKATILLSLSRA